MKLNDKQREYRENVKGCEHRWNFKEGAVRSGKTYFDIIYTLPYRITNAPKEGTVLLIGNTLGSLEQNVLSPMREHFGDPDGKLVGYVKPNGYVKIFGRKCRAYGADKVSTVKKIHGATVCYCYGDEVTTWNEEVFTELKARMSVKGAKFDGTCNPEGPNHWLLSFLRSDADIYRQKYLLSDNQEFLPEDYYENIQKEYESTVYYDRYILGNWTLAEGLVYRCFNIDTDPLDKVPEKLTGRRIIGCDYGTANPCVFLLAEEGYSGTWYITKEYYYSGRKELYQKTDEDYCDDFEVFVGDLDISKIVVDPSALSFIIALRKRGWIVLEAENNVNDGIRNVMTAFNTGKLKVLKCCTNTIRELGSYRWNPKAKEDEPIKEDDHCPDAIRYIENELTMRESGEVPEPIPELHKINLWN